MNNTQRSLKGVVSLDGWIGEFDKKGQATVHADVSFLEGTFGGNPANKVSFTVRLTAADVIVRIPSGEKLIVVKNSVARTPVAPRTTKETTLKTKRKMAATLSAGANAVRGLFGGGSLELSGMREMDVTEKEKELIGKFITNHFKTDSGYGWRLKRHNGGTMDGTPWSAADEPRMTVRRTADRNPAEDRPTLVLEIRCLRKNLYIDNVTPKDAKALMIYGNSANRSVNLAAAEQIIKEELLKAGFMQSVSVSESEPHEEILIADVIIYENV